MNRNVHRTTDGRRGFTLVELLVVIAIIAVLVGLIMPAIQRARVAAQKATAMNDIGNLSVAIGNAKSTLGARYVPCYTPFSTADLQQFFGTRFIPGATPPSTVPVSSMTGNQCLTFFLGGYNGLTYCQGFSQSSSGPFTTATPPMRPPFMDFPGKRLNTAYSPPLFNDPWGTPYFYMATYNGTGDYYPDTEPTMTGSATMTPFKDVTGKYWQMTEFQIVSAGPNMLPGPGISWPSAAYSANSPGGDDLANFSGTALGSQ